MKDGNDIEWPGMNTNGCDYISCPLTPNELNVYNFTLVTDRSARFVSLFSIPS